MSTLPPYRVTYEFVNEDTILKTTSTDRSSVSISSKANSLAQRYRQNALQGSKGKISFVRAKDSVNSGPGNNNKSHLRRKSGDDFIREIARLQRQAANVTPGQLVQLSHPLTILKKGGSYPFNVYAMPIRAETNETLLFYQQNVLPLLIACIEANGIPVSSGWRQSWHDPFSSLHDECAGYGLLSRTAVVMSRSAEPGSRLAMNTLLHKKKTSELLRARLAEGEQEIYETKIYQIVVSMFITAVCEDALEEATVHIKMLKYLLYDHPSRVGKEVDLRILYTILWYEFHRAAKGLTRPMFDFSGWVADLFRPDWKVALKYLPKLSGRAETDLDNSINDWELDELFINVRKIVEILALVTKDPSITSPPTQIAIAQWMIVWQAQCIEIYIDLMENLDAASVPPLKSATDFEHSWNSYTKAYICLAALWWTRCLRKEENAPTGPALKIFNGNIIPALKTALIQSKLLSSGMDQLVNSRVRLWALYVGALAEQYGGRVFKMRIPGRRSEESWFMDELLAQARTVDVLAWADLRDVLRGFLFSDSIEPHGSTWFTSS